MKKKTPEVNPGPFDDEFDNNNSIDTNTSAAPDQSRPCAAADLAHAKDQTGYGGFFAIKRDDLLRWLRESAHPGVTLH